MTHTDVAPTRERYLVSLEALANISIICVSVLLAWVVKDRFLTRSAPAPRSALTIGMKLPLPSFGTQSRWQIVDLCASRYLPFLPRERGVSQGTRANKRCAWDQDRCRHAAQQRE